nr:hypothetical protein [Candidatus Sigynarchaeota archaeon]
MYFWILVLGTIGGILMLATEFAGYNAPPSYYWYSIYVGTENPDHIPYVPLLVTVAVMFFFNAIVGLMGLGVLKIPVGMTLLKIGRIFALIILITGVAGIIAFEIVMANSSASDWWWGPGAFATIIGGALLLIQYIFVIKTKI